jgi:hypothetical protein
MLYREHLPGSSDATLDLVGHEEDPVPCAQLPDSGEPPWWGHDIPTLSHNRFDKDGRNVSGVQVPVEEIVLDPTHTEQFTVGEGLPKLTTIAVSVGHVVHVWEERAEACPLYALG